MKAIFINELRLYLFSWLGWSVLIIINAIAALGMITGVAQFGAYAQLFYAVDIPIILSILIVGSRSLSKDKELGLFSLFFTSPIKIEHLFLGKFFALVCFFLIALVGILFYPLFSGLFVSVPWISILSGLVAVSLQIVFFSAVAIFASAFSTNSMISAIIGLGIWIGLTLLGATSNVVADNIVLKNFLQSLSYAYHFGNINSGNFAVSDVLFYVFGAFFFIKLAESKVLAQVAR